MKETNGEVPGGMDRPPSAPDVRDLADDEESAPLILSTDGEFSPAVALTSPSSSSSSAPPTPTSSRRTRTHHHVASRLVQVSAVLFVLSTVASVGHFAPGSATRLVLGARMPDFSGVDQSYGTVRRGEDVREPEGVHDESKEGGECQDILLFLPGAGNPGGGGTSNDLSAQLGAYVVASLAATYTDMALVLLDDASDSSSVGCPDDTVEEHGSSFHFDGHYKIFPRGLSTLVKHPAWLSRGCGPPCPGSYGYGDWLQLSNSAADEGFVGAAIPGAASVLCEESTSNVLVVTAESVFDYFHQLRTEMVDRTRAESIRKSHTWAVALGAAEDEAVVMSTLQDGEDIMDYAEALASRTGIPMLQPWISRDVQSYVAANKMENWMAGTHPAVYKPEYHIPFEEYLLRFAEVKCGTHHAYVATAHPFAVQDAMQSLPTIRGGRYTVDRQKRCLGFTFRVGPTSDDGRWVRNPNCRHRYDETVAAVAELMVLARSSILVGDLSTSSGRLARFLRSDPTKSTSVIRGEGRPTTSRPTLVMGDESESRHVYHPPASVSAADLTVHYYIKSSGLPAYLDRARHSADTWARDADPGSVTFLFDNHQAWLVDRMADEHPWITVRHVEGTDHQGDYKGHGRPGVEAAHAAQHLKTRAVFDAYTAAGTTVPPDWVCYLDDDMMVNPAVLKEDLAGLAPSCSPDCLVADGQVWTPNGPDGKGSGMIQPYTVGGYCVSSHLVGRVAELFAARTDAEIGWVGTDDLHFNKYVMQGALGVTVTNSERWYSEYAYPDVDEYGFHKHTMHQDRAEGAVGTRGWMRRKPTWEKDGELMAKFVPSLAVYHVGYDNN